MDEQVNNVELAARLDELNQFLSNDTIRAAATALRATAAPAPTDERAAPVTAWRPIESAPRDGSLFQCWPRDDEHATASWCERRQGFVVSCCGQGIDLTHWMPLPPPPTERAE